MNTYGIIYKITNKINGKSYIGLTTTSLKKRWLGHKYSSKTENYPLYYSIRKYGIENFTIELITECYSKQELNSKEKELIIFYKCRNRDFGYNLDEGGNSFGKMSEEVVKQNSIRNSHENHPRAKLNWNDIFDILENKENLSMIKLRKKYNISESYLSAIFRSEYWNIKDAPAHIKEKISIDFKPNIIREFDNPENNNLSELNWKEVISIRLNKEKLTQDELAEKYKVSYNCIRNILLNKSWLMDKCPDNLKQDLPENFCKIYKKPKDLESFEYVILNWEDVTKIRINEENLSNKDLAKKYNTSHDNILLIIKNRTWQYNNCPKNIKEKLMDKYDFSKIDTTIYIPNKSKALSWEKVIEIRINEDNLSNAKLVKKYKLKQPIISKIMNNQSYKMEKCPKDILDKLSKDFKINYVKANQKNVK